MLRRRLRPVLALALATSACAEQPSFWVRWELARAGEGAEAKRVESVDQCTELGISRVRITTLEGGAVVDERDYPCFPEGYPELPAPGPELGAGTYTVQVTALSRRGVPFTVTVIDDITKEETVENTAFAIETITVSNAGKRPEIDFPIFGVAECDDGVDNDLDGYSDLADPSCESRDDVERGDQSVAQVTVRPRLLGDNPAASCGGLGLSRFVVELVGAETYSHAFECGAPSEVFSAVIPPGDYEARVLGQDFQGETRAIVELPGEPDIAVRADTEYVAAIFDVDFTLASFVEPIEAGFNFSLEYGDDASAVTACSFGALQLGAVRITPLAGGEPTTVTLFDDAQEVLDGEATIDCGALTSIRTAAPLTWGEGGVEDLALRVEAFSADDAALAEPCFANTEEPFPLAPNATVGIRVPRVSTEGLCAD